MKLIEYKFDENNNLYLTLPKLTNKNVQATEETKAISPKRDIRLKQKKLNKKSIIESKKKDLKIVVPEFYNYDDKLNGES